MCICVAALFWLHYYNGIDIGTLKCQLEPEGKVSLALLTATMLVSGSQTNYIWMTDEMSSVLSTAS